MNRVWIVLDHRCSEPLIDSVWSTPEAADNYIDELNMLNPNLSSELTVACYAVKPPIGEDHDRTGATND